MTETCLVCGSEIKEGENCKFCKKRKINLGIDYKNTKELEKEGVF